MTLSGTGYGAGTRQLPDRPNVVSVALGIPASSPARTATMTQSVEVLETNLDDVTGEIFGYVIARALEAGALDAWVTPAVMKKGRPAHVLHVLSRPGDSPALQHLLFTEIGTLGVRRSALTRTALPHGRTGRIAYRAPARHRAARRRLLRRR